MPQLKQGTTPEVDFLTVRGRFRRPPVQVNGLLYALATDGVLHQISPRRGARSKVAGEIRARGAGFNRNTATCVAAGEKNVAHGWVYLAASRDGVTAFSVATGAAEMVEEAGQGEALSANSSEADATGFRGMVASEEWYGFAAATEGNDFVLTLKSFSRERPAVRPFVLHGVRLAGPVLHDGLVVMCTEEEAGVYDVAGQVAVTMALPPEFAPLLRPSSEELSVAPGSIPMVGTRGRDGRLMATIAGHQDGAGGTLEVDFARKTGTFQRRPKGTSLSSNSDGSVSVNALDRMEWIGQERTTERVSSLEPGMPVAVEGEMRLWFAEQEYRGSHQMVMSLRGERMRVHFSDSKCTKDTCCGIYLLGSEVLVAYFDEGGEDGIGLRCARWSLT